MRPDHANSGKCGEGNLIGPSQELRRILHRLPLALTMLAFTWWGWALPAPGQRPGIAATPGAENVPFAAVEEALTLPALEQMALANNPSVARAAAMVGAARGNRVQVGLLPNPTVGYEGQQLGSGGRAEQHGVLFTQEMVRGGKLRLNRAVADHELARTQQELVAQQQRVLTDVRIAFYQVLLAQRQIELTSNLVHLSQQGANAVDALFRAQEANRPEILQARLEVENAQILAQNARNRHHAAWQGLAAVAGSPRLPPQPLAGNAFAPSRDIDFQRTLHHIQTASPEIAAAMAELDRARAQWERARVEPVPNVFVQGLVNVIDNGTDGMPNGGITLSVPIPVFNRNQGAILQAQHEIVNAESALRQIELNLQQRFAPSFERYANARNQVERYHAVILPIASESLDVTRMLYEAGEISYLGLLIAQRTYFQTNIDYLQAIQMLRIAEVEIEGLLLSNSLQ